MRTRPVNANGRAGNPVFLMAAEMGNRGREAPLSQMGITALEQMDRWLMSVANDDSDLSQAEKVRLHRPADLVDRCYTSTQSCVTDMDLCSALFPFATNALMVAGSPHTDEVFRCQFKAIDHADYTYALPSAQLEQIRAMFADGVCDHSLPDVGDTELAGTWLIYSGDGAFTPLGEWTHFEEGTGPASPPGLLDLHLGG